MKYDIDLSTVTDFAQVHLLLSMILPFPDGYGNNLDALFDTLTGMHDEQWDINFLNCNAARTQLGTSFDDLVKTFTDAEKQGAKLTVTWND